MHAPRRKQPPVVDDELVEVGAQVEGGGQVDRVQRAKVGGLESPSHIEEGQVDRPEVQRTEQSIDRGKKPLLWLQPTKGARDLDRCQGGGNGVARRAREVGTERLGLGFLDDQLDERRAVQVAQQTRSAPRAPPPAPGSPDR